MRWTFALALLAGWTGSASAQQQVTPTEMTITGFVDVVISGGGIQDLDFGTLTPGVATTVPVTSPSAAKWEFTGIPNNNRANSTYVDLAFTSLPAALTGPGGATIPLSNYVVRVALAKNGIDYHTYGDYTVTPATPSIDPNPRINPTGGAGEPPTAPGQGGDKGRSLVIYLGATVTPSALQRAGVYVGTLTITMTTSAAV